MAAGSQPSSSSERSAEEVKYANQLKQVTQRFFTKSALTIVSSRIDLPQTFNRETDQVKTNRWFNLVLDESDELAEQVQDWATFELEEERPPPLIIETYLDTEELSRNQTLVVVDERRRKWDVCEALAPPSNAGMSIRNRKKKAEVILERWKISLGSPPPRDHASASEPIPNVYKRAIVLMRSLYTYCRFLPAWKFGRFVTKQPASLTQLQLQFRVLAEEPAKVAKDLLQAPLYPSPEPVTSSYQFHPNPSPAGTFNIDVVYRNNCNFRIDDSEALLSSHLMGIDDNYFRPSLEGPSSERIPYLAHGKEVGSLPTRKDHIRDIQDTGPAYGSLSTFHNAGALTGTSPMSALRAAREMSSDSPPTSPPRKPAPDQRSSQGSKSSLKSPDPAVPANFRRVSVSFQPFKAGSLSSSPNPGITPPLSPRTASRTSDITTGLALARNVPLAQNGIRQPPSPTLDILPTSPGGSSSPRAPTITRYSSSFASRRSRLSTGGSVTKADDSSGKSSESSSKQPGSGMLPEAAAASTASGQNDDDNISEYLTMLEKRKDLRSFRADESSRDASARRTNDALSRFRGIRESHVLLTDSFSSSTLLQQGSDSSSRQSSSVPPLVSGTSASSSSSPKGVSPHTPHTPAIRSRLSANFTIDDPGEDTETSLERAEEELVGPRGPLGQRARPVDIPTSPQPIPYVRRSSSAAQRREAADDLDDEETRSTSLPLGQQPPGLSLNTLIEMEGQPSGTDSSSSHTAGNDSSQLESSQPWERKHLHSRSALTGRLGSRDILRVRPAAEEDEPLLFTMSEVGHGRRSVEDVQARPSELDEAEKKHVRKVSSSRGKGK